MGEILKHYEKPAHEYVTINHDRQGRENTYMNNGNDTQHSNMQEHIVNQTPLNHKQEENQKHIPVHQNRDKPDQNTNTQTYYRIVIKKLDRLTYN